MKSGRRIVNIIRVGICHTRAVSRVGVKERTAASRRAKTSLRANSHPSKKATRIAVGALLRSKRKNKTKMETREIPEEKTTKKGNPLGWLERNKPRSHRAWRGHMA